MMEYLKSDGQKEIIKNNFPPLDKVTRGYCDDMLVDVLSGSRLMIKFRNYAAKIDEQGGGIKNLRGWDR